MENDFNIRTLDQWNLVGHKLIKDVVGALERLLGDDTSLLQQIHLDVAAGQLAVGGEVDADELALREKKICMNKRTVVSFKSTFMRTECANIQL